MENENKELDRLGIVTTQWSWLRADYSGYETRSTGTTLQNTGTKQPSPQKSMGFASAVVLFLVALWMVSYATELGGGDALINVFRGFVMLIAALMVCSKKLVPVIIGSIISGLFVLGALPSLFSWDSTSGIIALSSLVTAFGIAWLGAPLFKKEEYALTLSQRVYGVQPTEWGNGSDDSNASSVWVMGLLLNKLTKIPGVYVFHGLKSPGGKWFDAEHAVTHGNNLYLIDSGFRTPRSYGWQINKKGKAFLAKGDDGHRHKRMDDAAERYRSALGPDITVIPMMVIVHGDASIGGERWSPRGVGLFTAEEAMAFIGDTAAESLPSWRDNPEVRVGIINTVVG